MSSREIRGFISIDLDDQKILSSVESVMSSLLAIGADLKPVERENIHLTLKFLGSVSVAKIDELKSSLSRLKFAPFKMEIKGAGAFPSLKRINVIWVGIGDGWTQIEPIYEQTEKLMSELGFSRETRPFNPHITIARVRSPKKRDELGAFLSHLREESFGTFSAEHVRLKQSILSPSGPKYSALLDVSAQK